MPTNETPDERTTCNTNTTYGRVADSLSVHRWANPEQGSRVVLPNVFQIVTEWLFQHTKHLGFTMYPTQESF